MVPLTAVTRVETVLTAAGIDTGVLEADELGVVVAAAVVAAGAVLEELTPGEVDVSEVLAMEPVAVPVLAAADAGSESDPLAPHADKTTQHATMDAPRPKDRDIWKLARKAGVAAFRQTPTPATMSRDGDYVFVSMRLTGST